MGGTGELRTTGGRSPRRVRSSSSTSRAVCQRSSGSLASARATMWSSAGGETSCRDEGGGGVRFRIDAMMLAWLSPGNARSPVAIS